MTELKVENLKRLGVLTTEGGWNGGRFLLDGVKIGFCDLPKTVVLGYKSQLIQAKVSELHGTDDDHGHQYSWVTMGFTFKVSSPFGHLRVGLKSVWPKKGEIILYMEP